MDNVYELITELRETVDSIDQVWMIDGDINSAKEICLEVAAINHKLLKAILAA